MAAEKDYAYVLGRTSSSSGYVTLNVLLMDGTASTLKLTKSDYDSLFKGNSDFETAYAYTMNGEGVADLTAPAAAAPRSDRLCREAQRRHRGCLQRQEAHQAG